MSRPLLHRLLRLAAPCALLFALPVHAQLSVRVPDVRLPPPDPLLEGATDSLGALPKRIDPVVRRLLQRHPDRVALDPAGHAILRHEVVAIDPTEPALARAGTEGFEARERRALEELGLRVVVLRAPSGMDTTAALARLRELDPAGSYDFNHLYSGSTWGSALATAAVPRVPPAPPVAAPARLRIGLVDSGVDATHPVLRGTDVHAWGCDGSPAPGEHGTAIASLLGATTLYSADIYCGASPGGSVTAFAAALAWMARERVPVVNISLVGPDNLLLRRATQSLLDRGHVLVAAVGNDGPAAAPLFPAAYPGVIGVTAVDPRRRALPEALRGPQVDFAAQGSGLRAATPGGGWHKVRGTSFAAPRVAHAAAALIDQPGTAAAARVLETLAAGVVDLGRGGRDDTYGFGLLP